MANHEIENSKDFEEKVKNSKGTVLCDFFATWCGPCRMLAPILEQIMEEYPDKKIYKVDVDKCFDVAKFYGIMSVPTMIVFKDGQATTQMVGLRTKQQILDQFK